jgi:uroporphyrinogen decarboxylase
MAFIDDWPWKSQPDYTRLLAALHRQGKPGYVPFLELFADREVIAAFVGGRATTESEQRLNRSALEEAIQQKVRFWHCLGYDAIWQGAPLDLEFNQLEAGDTASLPHDRRRWMNEGSNLITSWEDFERYPWPTSADADLYAMEYMARYLPEGMGIIAQISGALEPVTWLMGYKALALALYDQPDLVKALFAKIWEIYVPLAQTLAQMERVIGLWMGDDMGFRSGTLISPDHLRCYVFPYQKKIAEIAHNQGTPFLLHSCGNLDAVMEDLIDDVGIDAKHSFEDAIQPVESFAASYGNRIAVIGGVDVDLLSRGSQEQVRRRTRQILEDCAPSRAYILGSGNSIANYVQPENFLAMLDEGWRFNTGG